MNQYTEEARKIPVKFIVYSEGWFMCSSNWSKSYSAGVIEFDSEEEAVIAAKLRCKNNIQIYGFNEIGERIK